MNRLCSRRLQWLGWSALLCLSVGLPAAQAPVHARLMTQLGHSGPVTSIQWVCPIQCARRRRIVYRGSGSDYRRSPLKGVFRLSLARAHMA
jgi:hypothetical protein